MRTYALFSGLFVVMLLWLPVNSSKKFCKQDRKKYAPGKVVPSKESCKTCTCEENEKGGLEIVCSDITCPKKCDDRLAKCCGKCENVKPSRAGKLQCNQPGCPKLSCSKRYQFKNNDNTCCECKCRYKGKTYNPGPVLDRCDGCVCNGTSGRVTCQPPVCTDVTVQCMDPVKGDNCCYQCPNGKTCSPVFSKKTVIADGEFKKFPKQNKVCTCLKNSWYPYAFCASLRVNKKPFKGYLEYIAPYMKI